MKLRIAARKNDLFREILLNVKILNQKGNRIYADVNGFKFVFDKDQKPVLHTFDNGFSWIQYSIVK